jgi:hypothetical protein
VTWAKLGGDIGLGSRIEVLPGTVEARGGPHPTRFHLDEVELMDPIVWDKVKINTQPIKIPGVYTGRTAKGRARRT